MLNYKDKKILFFSPKFFGYEKEINNILSNKFMSVFFYDERANPSTIEKILIRLNIKFFIKNKINKYYKNIIDKFENNYFDYVLFFNPETITVEILKQLKNKQNKARYILYMWDSMKNKPYTVNLISLFDMCYTFNKYDVDKYGMKFRPLFFIDAYDCDKINKSHLDIDIGFIGTIHSDRFFILREIKQWAEENDLTTYFFMYFPSKILYYKYKLNNFRCRDIKKEDFQFKSLSSKEIRDVLNRCKVIIDIQHPKQTGLTIRTIEMLGMKKKLITTNQDIVSYDFYNEKNIEIIDRNNIKINKDFFQSEYDTSSDSVRQNYRIDSFIEEILI